MTTRFFSKDHEWLDIADDTATIGITHYAQGQLGDVVFVDLPKIGATFKAGTPAATVESVKAASEVYAPISGVVTAVNTALNDNPALVNEAAENDGWFFKITLSDASETASLMDAAAYKKHCGE